MHADAAVSVALSFQGPGKLSTEAIQRWQVRVRVGSESGSGYTLYANTKYNPKHNPNLECWQVETATFTPLTLILREP